MPPLDWLNPLAQGQTISACLFVYKPEFFKSPFPHFVHTSRIYQCKIALRCCLPCNRSGNWTWAVEEIWPMAIGCLVRTEIRVIFCINCISVLTTKNLIFWAGMRIRIQTDPLIFGPPDPDLFSLDLDPDPTCNNEFIQLFSSWTKNIYQNQQIQAKNDGL